MRCPSCGADNAAGLRFCKRCWRPFDDERPQARPGPVEGGRHTAAAPARRPLFGVPYAEDEPEAAERTDGFVAAPPGALAPIALHAAAGEREPDRPWGDADPTPSPRAVLSFVLGLLSIVLFCLSFITVPLDLSALVLGISELRDINGGLRPRAGRGFAVAGVILSAFALVVKVFLLLV